MPRKTTSKKLVCASGQHCFYTHNGAVLKDLKMLSEALKDMSADSFKHHVNAHKNDFASWTEVILKEPELAKAMRKVKTKAALQKRVDEFLKAL